MERSQTDRPERVAILEKNRETVDQLIRQIADTLPEDVRRFILADAWSNLHSPAVRNLIFPEYRDVIAHLNRLCHIRLEIDHLLLIDRGMAWSRSDDA